MSDKNSLLENIKKDTSIASVPKKNKGEILKDFIESRTTQIEKILPSNLTLDRVMQLLFNAMRENKKLLKCTKESILGSMIKLAQLGLEPAHGMAYLVPYQNRQTGIYDAQLQIGYRGLLRLLYNTGKASNVYAEMVYKNDEFSFFYGLSPNIIHVPADYESRGEIIGCYAVIHFKDNKKSFKYMSKGEIDVYKNKAQSSAFWSKHYEAMAKKTVIRQLVKYAEISFELIQQASTDTSIVKYDTTYNSLQTEEIYD